MWSYFGPRNPKNDDPNGLRWSMYRATAQCQGCSEICSVYYDMEGVYPLDESPKLAPFNWFGSGPVKER